MSRRGRRGRRRPQRGAGKTQRPASEVRDEQGRQDSASTPDNDHTSSRPPGELATPFATPLQDLDLPARALDACRTVGVQTIADYLSTPQGDFLAVPRCGPSTVADMTDRVHGYLLRFGSTAAPDSPAATSSPWEGDRLDQPLADIVSSPRAALVYEQLGIVTLREFLETPRAQLLSVSRYAERTYRTVVQHVLDIWSSLTLDVSLVPQRWLAVPVDDLGLGADLLCAVQRAGLASVADLLTAGNLLELLGPEGHATIHDAIDRMARDGIGTQPSSRPATSWTELLDRLTEALDPEAVELLTATLGLRGAPARPSGLTPGREGSAHEVRRQLAAIRRTLEQRVPVLLEQLKREGDRELTAAEGWLTRDGLDASPLLLGANDAPGGPGAVLRLLSFCFPGEFHQLDSGLTRTTAAGLRALRIALRRLTRPAMLPLSLSDLEQQVASRLPNVERGLLLHMIHARRDLSIRIDPVAGEVVERQPDELADVAELSLLEHGAAMLLEDLFFACKDIAHCARGEILSTLRTDPRFVEVGVDTWDLRDNHAAELDELASEARRIAERIREAGGRHAIRDLMKTPVHDRDAFLIANLLRRDSRLRDLGRGDFCAADQDLSSALQDLCADLRRAMGEVPTSRFLDNQTPERRRLIEGLLRQNRLFVSPAPDRIDLLENYPFNERRLRELVDLVTDALASGHGYSSVEHVTELVSKTHLGGDFLTPHLLGDLLRRHGPFELLPGGIVAQADLDLCGWILHRAREALRAGGLPMSPSEIVLEVPELAEFEDGLALMLDTDPMVARANETQFVVV